MPNFSKKTERTNDDETATRALKAIANLSGQIQRDTIDFRKIETSQDKLREDIAKTADELETLKAQNLLFLIPAEQKKDRLSKIKNSILSFICLCQMMMWGENKSQNLENKLETLENKSQNLKNKLKNKLKNLEASKTDLVEAIAKENNENNNIKARLEEMKHRPTMKHRIIWNVSVQLENPRQLNMDELTNSCNELFNSSKNKGNIPLTNEEKVSTSTRDLIGAVIAFLKHPSTSTQDTLERRYKGYREACEQVTTHEPNQMLNEILAKVKTLDPSLNYIKEELNHSNNMKLGS
ncbi:MAG: hypothetical protein Q8R24_00995 [Legionellaceae bacterium]|nr:hypothetical protein [Legionellaceae bacterium]